MNKLNDSQLDQVKHIMHLSCSTFYGAGLIDAFKVKEEREGEEREGLTHKKFYEAMYKHVDNLLEASGLK